MVIDVNSNNNHHSSGTGVSTLNTSTDPTESTFFTPGFSPKYFRGHFTDDEERHALVGYPRIDSKREAEGLLRCIPSRITSKRPGETVHSHHPNRRVVARGLGRKKRRFI